MKSLKSQNLIHDQNYALFPEGAIINETDQNEGTPVVREVYNDLLINFYALLKDRGINLNNLEDNEVNGYQIINALKLVFNNYSDVYHILTKNENGWFLNLDLSIAPEKTVFFIKASENYQKGNDTLYDSRGFSFNLSFKNDVKTGDDCILIYDNNNSRIINLNGSDSDSIGGQFATFGNPISNQTSKSKLWYLNDGFLSNMNPDFYDIQAVINGFEDSDFFEVKDCVQIKNKLIFLCFESNTNRYRLYSFDDDGLFKKPSEVSSVGLPFSQTPESDLGVYMYANGYDIYFTNQGGNNIIDGIISRYQYDSASNQITHIVDHDISSFTEFEKSSNIVCDGLSLVCLDAYRFNIFDFAGSAHSKETYSQLIGQIFKVENEIYFTDGHNAKKIDLNVILRRN